MPLLGYDRLLRGLAAGELGGVFFLFGEDDFLREEAANRIAEAHLDPATRDFNLDQLRATDVQPEMLASALQTPPMMAAWRVVVLREAQHLATAPRLREALESVLDAPPEGLAVVVVAQIPPRSRAQFYETLKRKARSVEFQPLDPGDVPGWLMERAAAEGISIDPAAARALAAAIGPNTGVLTQELQKLRDFVGDGRTVTTDDVAQVAGHLPRQNRWDWFDMVGQRRFREARAALPILLDAGETGVGLVLGLGTHFLRLALAAEGGAGALADELPTHQRWLAPRLEAQARRWTADALARALDDLLRADRLLKSAGLSDDQVLEELLLRLEAASARAAA